MKIAVSSTGPELAAPLDPRLGRCEYLLIVDADTMEFEAIENENKTRGGGAGIQTARTIAERGATVVLTGNCGPNAHETLTAAGVQVITGMAGSVQDALDCWKRGEVAASDGPNVQSHAGMGGGGGRGMGGGGGMGMRTAGGTAPPISPGNTAPAGGTDEVSTLRQEVQQMTRQLNEVLERLRRIEKG